MNGTRVPSVRGPFRCMAADPPWMHDDSLPGKTRGAAKNYSCLSFEEIRDFPIPPMMDDAYLFLWRVSSMVEEAYAVARAWGFDRVDSEIVWRKLTKNGLVQFGMGRAATRQSHETCIIARRGSPSRRSGSVRSIFDAPIGRHSEKPKEFFSIVEELAWGPYVELFARERRSGWVSLGDQVPKK